MRPADWLPPLVWMAVIFGLSSSLGSSEETSRFVVPLLRWLFRWAAPGDIAALHGLVRKGGHLTEYAVLGALWFRAFRRGPRLAPGAAAWSALTLSVAWAGLDEWHQSFVPARTAENETAPWPVATRHVQRLLAAIQAVGWDVAAEHTMFLKELKLDVLPRLLIKAHDTVKIWAAELLGRVQEYVGYQLARYTKTKRMRGIQVRPFTRAELEALYAELRKERERQAGEDQRGDRADLELPEAHSDARPRAASEGDVGPLRERRPRLRSKALGAELLRLVKHVGQVVRGP